MKSRLLLISIVLVTFLVSAIVHLPIQALLAYAPLPAQLRISGASGSLWQGQVQQVQWQRYNLGQVSWQLQPSKLLAGKVQANVRLGQGNPWKLRARGVVGYGLQGAYAENVIASLPATEALKFAPPLPVPLTLTGQLELSLQSWQYAAPYCRSGHGQLVWNTDTVTTPLADLRLGPVVAEFTCQESIIDVTGEQQSEQVQSAFSAQLNAKREYTASAWFSPQAEMPEALRESLKWLPQPNSQGRYQFSYRGRM
ncbi:general secretion pathway protein GspN [Vibrio panuliri]|uniref:Type II secretion system protein N n=1 Tax=Vibrio panuliri TaxID=1381081 RepID=A0A1Q9HAB9_9VIBR|nr:type II secretion system protein N [Vibrio panuliri]OLQ86075.1 general secretion pathway protein GspN [Vibrio panuliri]